MKETAAEQIGRITLAPVKAIEINSVDFIKSELVYKSYAQQKDGDIKGSEKTLKKAKQIQGDDAFLEKMILDIERDNKNQKYSYHVEDGRFSFDFDDTTLLGKEGEIIKVDDRFDGETEDDIYILYIDGFDVECIGNIERRFPRSKREHDEIKKAVIRLHAAY